MDLSREERKLQKVAAEENRIHAMKAIEQNYYNAGVKPIAGIDEVGRGPLAGPVVACAVILPEDALILGVKDSKKLSASKRETLAREIRREALAVSIGIVDCQDIDRMNILNATYLAMKKAIQNLGVRPKQLLVDGYPIPDMDISQEAIIKGDNKSFLIACASIVAKVYRDNLMVDYDTQYPGYGFAKHKGYGTPQHLEAVLQLGLCPIHRRTFVKNLVEKR